MTDHPQALNQNQQEERIITTVDKKSQKDKPEPEFNAAQSQPTSILDCIINAFICFFRFIFCYWIFEQNRQAQRNGSKEQRTSPPLVQSHHNRKQKKKQQPQRKHKSQDGSIESSKKQKRSFQQNSLIQQGQQKKKIRESSYTENNEEQNNDTHEITKKQPKKQYPIYHTNVQEAKYSAQNHRMLQKMHNQDKEKYKGLVNLGSTCYANSALQCLQKFNCFNYLLKFKAGGRRKMPPLTSSYLQLLSQFNRDLERPYQPKTILSLVTQRNCIFSYGQSDSVEFLSTFLAGIGQELNERPFSKKKKLVNREGITDDDKLFEATKVRDRVWSHSIVEQTFTGYYKTAYKCDQCQERYVLFEKFNVHYVPLPQPSPWNHSSSSRKPEAVTTLQECLKMFNNPEKMEGQNAMDCDNPKCNRHSPRKRWSTTKTMEIAESNKILVLCLKRFHENRKNDREVAIPFQLDPSDVVGSNNGKRYDQKKYRLYGVIVHIGHSLNGGHYYAYCRVRGDKWIKCDDRWVDEVQKKDLDFRGAYALFYQLQEKSSKNP